MRKKSKILETLISRIQMPIEKIQETIHRLPRKEMFLICSDLSIPQLKSGIHIHFIQNTSDAINISIVRCINNRVMQHTTANTAIFYLYQLSHSFCRTAVLKVLLSILHGESKWIYTCPVNSSNDWRNE